MSSNLVLPVLALIFLSINPTSYAFPALASSISGTSFAETDSPLVLDALEPSMLQEVPFPDVISGYSKMSSKIRSYLPGNPLKGLFKSDEDFVIEKPEQKQSIIDPRFLKVASAAVGHLFPTEKNSVPAIGAPVVAPVGAVIGDKASAVTGVPVGKASSNQKFDLNVAKKVSIKAKKPKSLEASVRIQHPVVGEQYGRIALEGINGQ
ncbi:uncharacterized protein LOC112538669 [Tetranychus urticae]|uniref:Uncharacterized protein n=1 Tax=Tetranychus urticae TaxID=32264 RepID=T1K464_TETUR|nr:uncharacterized protein LOC112538669 [Tetranychus urticae]